MTQGRSAQAGKNILFCFVLFACVFFVYRPFLNNDFVADDAGWLWSGKHYKEMYLMRHPSEKFRAFPLAPVFVPVPFYQFLRPVSVSSFAALYYAGGTHAFPYYFFMVFLHALNTCLVFVLVGELLAHNNPFSVNRSWTAFFTALLFGTFFLPFQAVAWISCIEYLWMFLFFALCFIFYLKFLRTRHIAFYVFSLLAYVCSFLSLELGIMLPFLLVCADALFNSEKLPRLRLLKNFFPFFAAGCAYFVFLKFFFYPHLPYIKPKLTDLSTLQHAFFTFTIFFTSLWSNLINPFARDVIVHTALPFNSQSLKITGYMFFFILLSFLLMMSQKNKPVSLRSIAKIYAFFLLWIVWNLLLPSLFGTKAIADTFGIPQSRQFYLPSCGMCGIVTLLLLTLVESLPFVRARALFPLVVVPFIFFSLHKSASILNSLDPVYEKASRQNTTIVSAITRVARGAPENATVVFVDPPNEGIRIYYGIFIPHYAELYTGKLFHILWVKEENLLKMKELRQHAGTSYFLKFSSHSLFNATQYYRKMLEKTKS